MTAILAFDCASGALSCAAMAGGQVRAHDFTVMERGQDRALMVMMDAVLARAGWQYADIDALAVTVGPGSYTGVRIGLAAARALALALSRPAVGVSGMAALARRAGGGGIGPHLVVMETRRADFYIQPFGDAGRPAGPAQALAAADIVAMLSENPPIIPLSPVGAPLSLVGDGAARLQGVLAARFCTKVCGPTHPDAVDVAAIAGEQLATGRPDSPEPLYLRPPDVTPPDPARRW